MRIVVTGGAGFIGRAVVKRLAERGDEVIALVRDPGRAAFLAGDRVTLVTSDLSDVSALTAQMAGADGVIHAAGMYKVGLSDADRPRMWDANVGATERVLDAAIAAGVPRSVYVSTVNAFGNTRGEVPDETYQRNLADGFLSYYDETKYRAHEAALKRIAAGAPILVAMPTQVYGPHDHSDAGAQLARAHAGRMPYHAFPSLGLAWIHVDDLAAGIVAVLDRGRLGESYVLSGAPRRLGEFIAVAARIGGRKPPRLRMPDAMVRLIAPLNDRVGRLPGLQRNLRETIRAVDGVTYWASSAKAERELGFTARTLEQGIADTWGTGAKAEPAGAGSTAEG